MTAARYRSTPRSVAAVALVIGLLLSFASAVAWAEWDEVEAAFGDAGQETFADAERRPRAPRPPAAAVAVATAAVEPQDVAGDDVAPPESDGGAGTGADPEDESRDEDDLGVPSPRPAIDAPAAAAATRDPGAARRRRSARALEQWLADHPEAESVAVAVVVGGPRGATWSGAAVAGDPGRLLDHTAAFPIMSVTKTFTEALVLRQAAAGHIDLDAPMPALDDVAPVPDGIVITPRMLLQHSSGLVNYMNASGYDPSAPMTPARAVSLSLGTPLLHEPGSRTHYSNSNFHWLGLLLEHVTGRPFADLVDDVSDEFALHSAFVDPAARPGWVGFASGGMRATLPDVARWGAHLFTPGAVLSPADLAAYRAVGPLGVGLGIWPICPCTTTPDGLVEYTAIGQIVADGGMLYFPDDDVVVAVRLARAPGDVGTLTASAAGAVRAAFADGAPARVQ